ncbi:uncharacterized protein ACHE_20406S [Aspergillus chevalieri]|uniref:Uncharacterized protein n=1 Tax=Aspergillus chevalieri TaxID=182096 RepID=A0A7R7ZK16_ASPCH|nr:uncharacterized protein ACHE_20406S [Aspergillus chevalieri]BCR84948.1 hypothetical protein ACHE_20406S [Aspergillus chevalieri]
MATTRLRRAFRYPEDSGDEGHEREELDEEEQERVIEQLQRQNDQRNAQYSTVFTALPLLSTLVFVPSVLYRSSTPTVRLFSFLSIMSLLVTTYIMKLFMSRLLDRKSKRPAAEVERTTLVRQSLLFTNTGICGILVLVYLFANPSPSSIWPGLYIVPGAMFGVILLVREAMVSVDLSHLQNLRYEYKGA